MGAANPIRRVPGTVENARLILMELVVGVHHQSASCIPKPFSRGRDYGYCDAAIGGSDIKAP